MPEDIKPGLATVVVKNGTSTSNAVAIMVPAVGTPGIVVYGDNRAVVINQDGTVNSPTNGAKVAMCWWYTSSAAAGERLGTADDGLSVAERAFAGGRNVHGEGQRGGGHDQLHGLERPFPSVSTRRILWFPR